VEPIDLPIAEQPVYLTQESLSPPSPRAYPLKNKLVPGILGFMSVLCILSLLSLVVLLMALDIIPFGDFRQMGHIQGHSFRLCLVYSLPFWSVAYLVWA
jgi:hypothetical protein